MVWSFTLTVAATTLLMFPPLSFVESGLSAIFLAGLIPQALVLAIPIGVTFGIALGMAGRQFSRATKRVVLLFALVASLASFVTLVWAMPAGNLAYRESVARAAGISGPLIKGASEMSLSELDHQSTIAAAAGNTMGADHYAWSFHLRFALPMASMVLAAFLFAAGGNGAGFRGLLALLVCAAYWVLIFVGESLAIYSPIAPAFAGTIPVFAGAWLPNIVIGAFAMIVASSRSSGVRGAMTSTEPSVIESPD
jgi:lipopolysaccharide export LptBFGC system permease protein LptF